MKLFAKIVNGSELLIIFAKNTILDVWKDSEYPLFWNMLLWVYNFLTNQQKLKKFLKKKIHGLC